MTAIRKLSPPIHCIPCRVTVDGDRYQIEANGTVRPVGDFVFSIGDSKLRRAELTEAVRARYLALPESKAKLVRREASRQRRNRNRRESDAAKRDMGLVRAAGGAFGGFE